MIIIFIQSIYFFNERALCLHVSLKMEIQIPLKNLLNSQNKNSVNRSAFCWMNLLVYQSESWIAFVLSRFKISFLISEFDILSNVRCLSLLFSLIALNLGWFLYFFFSPKYWVLKLIDINSQIFIFKDIQTRYYIWKEIWELCISPYSVRMRENADQNKSEYFEYRHFSRSEHIHLYSVSNHFQLR